MRVGFIQGIIANKKPDYEIAVIWYDKTDGEQMAEEDLSPAEWNEIAHKFSLDKHLNQAADELMSNIIEETLKKRTENENR